MQRLTKRKRSVTHTHSHKAKNLDRRFEKSVSHTHSHHTKKKIHFIVLPTSDNEDCCQNVGDKKRKTFFLEQHGYEEQHWFSF